MLTTLVLLTALTPGVGHADDLALTNIHQTQYAFGPNRASNKLLAGDVLYIDFEIEGLKIDANGLVKYSMGMVVTNSSGKKEFAANPTPKEVYNLQGSSTVTGSVNVVTTLDQPAGAYKVTVTVMDPSTKKSADFTRDFEVLPKGFGLVHAALTLDQMGYLSVGVCSIGQMPNVYFWIVGFERDPTTKQPNLAIDMNVAGADGKPMTSKPFVLEIRNGYGPEIAAVPVALPLHLNKAGKFTVDVTVTDKVSNKTAKLSLPVDVIDLKTGK